MHPLGIVGRRLVIGHRGNSARAPENTLESLLQAVALGVDAVEFDVRLTADGVPVVLHDPTLDRTTDRGGAVAALTYDELREVDAGARFTPDGGRTHPYRGRGIRIPRLDEVLRALPETLPIILELKVREAQHETLRVLRECGAAARTIVDSMLHDALDAFRGTEVTVGATAADARALTARACAWLPPRRVNYAALFVPRWFRGIPVPIRRLVAVATPLGAPVHVWTINDVREATNLWRCGVGGILTDDPEPVLERRATLLD